MEISIEHARVNALIERFAATPLTAPTEALVPNGDDAAVLRGIGAPTLSVDCAIEGVHFERAFASPAVLAERAFRAAMSDLAAMGVRPVAALSALTFPAGVDAHTFEAFIEGLATASHALGAPIIGGNLARGPVITIATTVLGDAAGGFLTRRGARPGDRVFVTGTLGEAAYGLEALLGAGAASEHDANLWRQRPCRIEEGAALIGHATAAIDVSDGLVDDAQQLAIASRVTLVVESAALPLAAVAAPEDKRIALALSGGEDYELLFTLPRGIPPPVTATEIGEVRAAVENAPVVCLANGVPITAPEAHFQHF